MATGAVSGILAALYLADPAAVKTTMTSLACVDAGAHTVFQAAWGYRRWSTADALTVQVDENHDGNWATVTTGFTVSYLTGKITFTVARTAGALVRVSGKRFAPVEVVDLCGISFDGATKMLGDAGTIRDAFEQYLPGKKNWKISSDLWFVNGTYWAMLAAGRLVAEIFYQYDGSVKKCLVGWAQIDGVNWSAPQDGLQTSKITIQGSEGLEWDTN
jgi:hypothetical protein